ncbi:MAG: hypothetical protein GF344_09055 [Chitinivibrionales bacterium]|nr:hypothetical protein [Chitinivibrionales bacterium]
MKLFDVGFHPKGHFGLLYCLCIVALASSEAPAQQKLLIVRETEHMFTQAASSMSAELAEAFGIYQIHVRENTGHEEVLDRIKTIVPQIAVLMGDEAIAIFEKCQRKDPAVCGKLPVVALFTQQLRQQLTKMPNATGIHFEIPIVISVIHLRTILGRDISRVGVLHPPALKGFVDTNAVFCAREGIELIPLSFTPRRLFAAIRTERAVSFLTDEQNVQLLWLPRDNRLFTNKLVNRVWRPFADKHNIPIIVSSERFVSKPANFGTLAVFPDYKGYGTQAAQLVFDIMCEDWRADEIPPLLPLSIYKVVNCTKALNQFSIGDNALRFVDKVTCAK